MQVHLISVPVTGTLAKVGERMRRLHGRGSTSRSGFAGFRFLPAVITVAVRWYLRYVLSYRDVEELLTEWGIEVDRSRLVHTPRYDLRKCV